MRVWHDNRRPAPRGWLWAKTNAAAKRYLSEDDVSEISLDYDMTGEKGLTLAQWMAETRHLPELVIIHSQNEQGARKMAETLHAAGAHILVAPVGGRYAPEWVIAKL